MEDFNLKKFIKGLSDKYGYEKYSVVETIKHLDWDVFIPDPETDEQHNELIEGMANDAEWRWKMKSLYSGESIQETMGDFLILSAVYWRLGTRKIETNPNEGLDDLFRAIRYLDNCNGILYHEQGIQRKLEVKQQKVQAGKLKAARFDDVKAEIIRLLKNKKPSDGWKKKIEAYRAIEYELYAFVENNGWPSSGDKNNKFKDESELSDQIHNRVMHWSRQDPNVKKVFDKVIRKK